MKSIEAQFALHRDGRLLVGRDRIRLLEAVAELSSITKAAKACGLSYKTAWDAVNAINNLMPTPAFITRPGGQSGGGAEVTDEGRRLIATFRQLEERLTRISALIARDGLEDQEEALLWAMGMRISTRNIFRTVVGVVRRWPVDVEVTLAVSDAHRIQATVTNDAADELGLKPGLPVLALVKASFIAVAPAVADTANRPNCFHGRIVQRLDAERNSEIRLDIGSGKSIVAVMPRTEVEAMALEEGQDAVASFDASHVILAVA